MRRAAGAACEFDVNDADVIDLLAGLTASPRTAPRRPPAWLEQQIDRIRWAWSPGMTVSSIAHGAGVHPVYLARVTRWSYGTSVSALLRDSRLRWAAAALINGHVSLSEIAQAAGFADQAHLSRSFTSELGLPPSQLRLLRDALSRVKSSRPTGEMVSRIQDGNERQAHTERDESGR
jgi:AraC family transcriptional regulator